MYTTKRKQHKSRDAGTERKYHNFRPISDLYIFGHEDYAYIMPTHIYFHNSYVR